MRLHEISSLQELFAPKPIELRAQTARSGKLYTARFNVSGIDYDARFRDQGDGSFDFRFGVTGERSDKRRYGNTGSQGTASVQVYAYAISALMEFLRRVKPMVVTFSGEAEDGKDTAYARMLRHMTAQLDALGYEGEVPYPGAFSVIRKGL